LRKVQEDLKMKTFLLSMAAAAALTSLAAPAAAQSYDRYDQSDRRYEQPYGRYEQSDRRYEQPYGRDHVSINQRQQRLAQRLDRGVMRGDLTRNEARRLHMRAREIAHLEARYRVNGLNSWERSDLDRRFDRLEAMVRFERRDGDNRRDYGRRGDDDDRRYARRDRD